MNGASPGASPRGQTLRKEHSVPMNGAGTRGQTLRKENSVPPTPGTSRSCDVRHVKDFQKRRHLEVLSELQTRFVELEELLGMIVDSGAQNFELNVGSIVHHPTRGPGQIVRIDFRSPRGKPYRVKFGKGEVHEYNAESALKLKGLKVDELAHSKASRRRLSLAYVVNLGTAGDDQFRVSPSLKVPPSTPNSHAKQIATMLGEKTSQEDAKKQLLLHRAVVRVARNATHRCSAAAVLDSDAKRFRGSMHCCGMTRTASLVGLKPACL